MERHLLPVLDDFIHTVHSILEFIYWAQDTVYTDSTLTDMEWTLGNFHLKKQCVIDLEAWKGMKGPSKHFNILSSFVSQTRANGALIQYTADMLEYLLITHCKTTFQYLVDCPEPLQMKSWR